MGLSNKAYNLLADSLAPKVVDYLFLSEEWVEFLQQMIPQAIDAELGEMDEDVLYDLAMTVMDKIELKVR